MKSLFERNLMETPWVKPTDEKNLMGTGDVNHFQDFFNLIPNIELKQFFTYNVELQDKYDGFSHIAFRCSIPKESTSLEAVQELVNALNRPEVDIQNSRKWNKAIIECMMNEDKKNYYLKGKLRLFTPWTWERWEQSKWQPDMFTKKNKPYTPPEPLGKQPEKRQAYIFEPMWVNTNQ